MANRYTEQQFDTFYGMLDTGSTVRQAAEAVGINFHYARVKGRLYRKEQREGGTAPPTIETQRKTQSTPAPAPEADRDKVAQLKPPPATQVLSAPPAPVETNEPAMSIDVLVDAVRENTASVNALTKCIRDTCSMLRQLQLPASPALRTLSNQTDIDAIASLFEDNGQDTDDDEARAREQERIAALAWVDQQWGE